MNYNSKLTAAFANALRLPLSSASRYVFISDCHRGNGTANDTFLKNQNLFFAALQYYYDNQYTYIELGDGDELWQNRSMSQISEIHDDVFWMMSEFQRDNRLYLIYGNHDIIKRSPSFSLRYCNRYYYSETRCLRPLLPDLRFYEGIILNDTEGESDIYLAHGHQADFINSTLWRVSRFLVRHLWEPLERIGFINPTSAARNITKKDTIERHLTEWATKNRRILITGHTHRPMLDEKKETPYLNTGSCVHPRCITAIELQNRCFTLVKWTYCTREDFVVYICRRILAGPVCIDEFTFDS